MAKGTAISLDFGATQEAILTAALKDKEVAMRSAKGWAGVVTVNIKADPKDEKSEAMTALVKFRSTCLELFQVIRPELVI